MDEENTELALQLEQFILDPKLEQLEKLLGYFNLFDVFKMGYNECLHSQLLRWLLDPSETHGLQEYFLKKFLIKAIQKNRQHQHLPFSAIDVDITDFTNAFVQAEEVFTNRKRADISILNESKNNEENIYILIENKINSTEGMHQTVSYVEQTKKRYKDCKRMYIYLTPQQEMPEAPEFMVISYKDVAEMIDEVLIAKKDSLTKNSEYLIRQLRRNIEVNILQEGEIERLCLEIYNSHKRALDKIFDSKPSNKQIYKSLSEYIINELGEDWTFHATNSYSAVFKKTWINKFNPNSRLPFFHYEFCDVGNGKIKAQLHIESWGDQDHYEEMKKHLRQIGFDKITGVDLEKAQVVMKMKQPVYIDKYDTVDDAILKAKDAMINMINESVEYLDIASEKIK